MKKILFISSSLRPKSNSELLAREAAKGAEEAGHSVEFVTLRGKTVGFCRGCLACQKTMACVIQDDANEIAEKAKDADTLVFATPIYYYELSGQLKTLLDRCNPLFPQEYRFRDVYLLTTSAEDGEEVYETAAKGLKGWIACFPKSRFAGVFSGGGINMEDIASDERFRNVREDARQFGKKL